MFKSLSKIARQATGSVQGFKRVLDLNPSISAFTFPPQVQAGIKVANALGIRVPTESELRSLAQGKIDRVLPGIRNTLTPKVAQVEKITKTTEDVLQKIEWLL